MKKFLKVICLSLVSLISSIILGYIVMSLTLLYPNYVSKNPDRIAARADIRLPEYNVVDSSVKENPITAWVEVKYIIMTDEPMDAKFIRRLDNLVQKDECWMGPAEEPIYKYHMYRNHNDGPRIDITVDVDAGRIALVYGWWNYR